MTTPNSTPKTDKAGFPRYSESVNVLAELPRQDYSPEQIARPVLAYLASLAAVRSRYVQGRALDQMAGLLTGGKITQATGFPWHLIRYEHTTALRTALQERYRPATVNRHLCALRGVLRAAWRVGLMTAEAFQRAADLSSVPTETLPAGREIGGGELAGMITVCQDDPTPAGVRDAAILAVLYGCGLRRAELAALSLTDYEPDRGRLRVSGKRQKERYAYLPAGASAALADWLSLRGSIPGALFVGMKKGGGLQPGYSQMTTQAVYSIVAKRARGAGVTDISPHDFRRTWVSDLLDHGADLAIVSRMAGHATVQTTARYDRRPEEAKQKTAGMLHVPYHRRTP
jgi:site-specific recombinase XerD